MSYIFNIETFFKCFHEFFMAGFKLISLFLEHFLKALTMTFNSVFVTRVHSFDNSSLSSKEIL